MAVRFAKHKHENVEEVGDVVEWMEMHGWTRGEAEDIWSVEVKDASPIPTALFGFVKDQGGG